MDIETIMAKARAPQQGRSKASFERMLATVDPHSPPEYRVNGVLSNNSDFQKAFACKAGQPMVRAQACRIW